MRRWAGSGGGCAGSACSACHARQARVSATSSSNWRRQPRHRWRVERLMAPGTAANSAGPTFTTLPMRAWYASRSAITLLGPW